MVVQNPQSYKTGWHPFWPIKRHIFGPNVIRITYLIITNPPWLPQPLPSPSSLPNGNEQMMPFPSNNLKLIHNSWINKHKYFNKQSQQYTLIKKGEFNLTIIWPESPDFISLDHISIELLVFYESSNVWLSNTEYIHTYILFNINSMRTSSS